MKANELGLKIKMSSGIGYVERRVKNPLNAVKTIAEKVFFANRSSEVKAESVCVYDSTGCALYYLKWLEDGSYRKEEVLGKPVTMPGIV